ncbi:hypothetical protein KOR42_03580 [Thalassoglobus neptunius]|uniref:Uncharacterized protein n=2 Tax=Thalassoglobus neptunius TaxID=1938619 RepID=A0A5C5X3V5_9PLAN|nr:hypothetical protein KOR42_03580 [Thalassoglobus neptunius]
MSDHFDQVIIPFGCWIATRVLLPLGSVFMSSRPPIVTEIVERSVKAIKLIDEDVPIGCHYFFGEPEHEITLFISPTEIVGGPRDGERIESRFYVDILGLLDVLDEVESYSWQAQPMDVDDQLSAHISLTGTYCGESIWLRILARTPEDFQPGCVANSDGEQSVNIWEAESNPE